MAFHLLINWSAIALLLVTAFALRPGDASRYLGNLTIAATVAAWVGFNLMHRRNNRTKNLLLTSFIAGMLVVGSLVLLA